MVWSVDTTPLEFLLLRLGGSPCFPDICGLALAAKDCSVPDLSRRPAPGYGICWLPFAAQFSDAKLNAF
jgi:hypothetical protein